MFQQIEDKVWFSTAESINVTWKAEKCEANRKHSIPRPIHLCFLLLILALFPCLILLAYDKNFDQFIEGI